MLPFWFCFDSAIPAPEKYLPRLHAINLLFKDIFCGLQVQMSLA
jgi:hypothetical protein